MHFSVQINDVQELHEEKTLPVGYLYKYQSFVFRFIMREKQGRLNLSKKNICIGKALSWPLRILFQVAVWAGDREAVFIREYTLIRQDHLSEEPPQKPEDPVSSLMKRKHTWLFWGSKLSDWNRSPFLFLYNRKELMWLLDKTWFCFFCNPLGFSSVNKSWLRDFGREGWL